MADETEVKKLEAKIKALESENADLTNTILDFGAERRQHQQLITRLTYLVGGHEPPGSIDIDEMVDQVEEIVNEGIASMDSVAELIKQNHQAGQTIRKMNEANINMQDFLLLLTKDIQNHPEALEPLTAIMRNNLDALVDGADVDLNSPLKDEDY